MQRTMETAEKKTAAQLAHATGIGKSREAEYEEDKWTIAGEQGDPRGEEDEGQL